MKIAGGLEVQRNVPFIGTKATYTVPQEAFESKEFELTIQP